MDWKECLIKKIAKSSTPDREMIESLIKTSENKIHSSSLLELTKKTAASKLSLSYDSLRELLEALAISKGYKIYNHECYTGFLNEVIARSDLANKFDRLRLLRNSINYYGESILISDAKEAVEEIKELSKEVRLLINE